jgi:hypothetical protein
MKIGITLNEVLRDFVGQLAYTYTKYIDSDFSIKEDEVTSSNLIEHFKFKNIDEFNSFIYDEAALEIFGHADQLHDNIMSQFNIFLMDIADEEEHEIILISREAMKSIPSTYFFLSKVLCKATNIKFVQNYEDMWDEVDVLVTATPEVLKNKPDGKISVKVNASYNSSSKGDYEIDNLTEFMEDEDFRERVMNDKITNYEEIK